ncbi:hypothetical protein ACFL59_10270 [Planctomycetota bacterium]
MSKKAKKATRRADTRKARDVTIAELAEQLGVSRPLVHQWVSCIPDQYKYRGPGRGSKWLIRAAYAKKLADPAFRERLTGKKQSAQQTKSDVALEAILDRLERIEAAIREQTEVLRGLRADERK